MNQKAGKTVFVIAIAAMLVIVGSLSYYYVNGGQEAYSGDGTPDTGDTNPTTNTVLAPDFTYYAVNGGTVSLSGLRGKIVILDFMATWCQPCKDQIDNLKTIQTEYASQNVVILSVNVDLQVSDSELLQYRSERGATWSFVTDSNGVSMNPKYSATSIPTLVFIGKDGAIAKRTVGLMSVEALRTAINPLL
jgi:thiol-disulfide isomerase/thioredoxin